MNNNDLQQFLAECTPKVLTRVEQCYQVAESKLKCSFPRPEILFTLRGKAAGTAHLQANYIRLNPLLFIENQQAFYEDVIPHEISHLLCYQLYPNRRIKPHGIEWQQIMRHVFARAPHTRHQFKVQSVQGQTFTYQCQCGTIELSIRRHNKVRRGQAQYACNRCRQLLTPLPI